MSFRVRVWLKGEPNPATGVIMDLGLVMDALKDAREALDHRYLNDIEGLSMPTLENIALWIWNRLSAQISRLDQVGVYRDSCGEGCEYYGPES